jgi:hypothetical protein
MKIVFVGNCQTGSLSFYFQQLSSNYDVKWLLYHESFKGHFGEWSDKIENKIDNYDIIMDEIRNSDVIVYQEICREKSLFCNTETFLKNKKESCRLIKIPDIYFDYSKCEDSIKELIMREVKNKVDIKVSDIFLKYRERRRLMNANVHHPTTFVFLKVLHRLCKLLNIDTLSKEKRNMFLQDDNYMKLP